MELVIVILAICVVVEFLTIRMLTEEYKEKEGLAKARTRSLELAEDKIRERNKLIKSISEKNEKQTAFIEKIILLSTSNKYKNEKTFIDKIKELVRDYQSIN